MGIVFFVPMTALDFNEPDICPSTNGNVWPLSQDAIAATQPFTLRDFALRRNAEPLQHGADGDLVGNVSMQKECGMVLAQQVLARRR